MEPRAVEGHDAGGLLAAMLQRVQAERRDRGGVGMAENAEDAALLAQAIALGVEAGFGRRVGDQLWRGRVHCLGAGAKGAFLLMSASSFCLSMGAPPPELVPLSAFFGAGAGVEGTAIG